MRWYWVVQTLGAGQSGNRLEERKQRLIEAFVYQQAIDPATYRREVDRIRDEEVVTEVELSENRMDELDVDGVLAFAEHVVLNAQRLWSEYNPQRRRHLQQVLFPKGLKFDGESSKTPVTCLFFRNLEAQEGAESQMVSPTGPDALLIPIEKWFPVDGPRREASKTPRKEQA